MSIDVRPMRESDVPEADRIFRLAFGTFLGMPDPMQFAGDADYIGSRFRSSNTAAFVAADGGILAGSNVAVHWGSVGFFGPLTVPPERWNGGIAQRLLPPVMDAFAAWGTTHDGLFTFAQSPKHVGLYGKFGFWPRFLTTVGVKRVEPGRRPAPGTFSGMAATDRAGCLADCRTLTDGLYAGLDASAEIEDAHRLGLGDTVLLADGRVSGLAVCHVGAGTEAGSDTCYVKFGAVRGGPGAEERFAALLEAVEGFATSQQVGNVAAGVNLARERAAGIMRERGYRTLLQGVAMHRPNQPGYSRPDVFALDDWR
jgi:predicted N-acetyltransferase YhbS